MFTRNSTYTRINIGVLQQVTVKNLLDVHRRVLKTTELLGQPQEHPHIQLRFYAASSRKEISVIVFVGIVSSKSGNSF